MKKIFFLFCVALSLMFIACGKGNSSKANGDADSTAITEPADTFDFEKYHQAFLDKAEINFMKSDADIRLVSYALIDIDNDGTPEVWVRGDEGQDYQGVYSIKGDSVVLLASGDVRTDLRFFKNAVGYRGYYGMGECSEGATIIKDSKPANSYLTYKKFNIYSDEQEVTDEIYSINGEGADSLACATFCEQLGDAYEPDVVWHTIRRPLIATPPPMPVITLDDNKVMLLYWTKCQEPLTTADNAEYIKEEHQIWEQQEQFRKNTSKYTNLIMPDGSTARIKYKDEQLYDPDGNLIFPGDIHYRPEIPNACAFLDIEYSYNDILAWQNGIIVTDDYLKCHDVLQISEGFNFGENTKTLPDDVVKQLEKKYKMKASKSVLSGRINNQYDFGWVQFNCVWKDAPKDKDFPDAKSCLAVVVLADGEKLYTKEFKGYYESEEDFGWNVDDGGEFMGPLLTAAFKGEDGLTVCYNEPAIESFTVGTFNLDGDKLTEPFRQVYHPMIDEELPVWNKDIATMQRMYIDKDPQARKNTKFTKWAHAYITYQPEWICVSDDKGEGAIFHRKDNKFKYIADFGPNRNAADAMIDDVGYLCISGHTGNQQSYKDIYAFRDDNLIEHFYCILNGNEVQSCTLNNKPISVDKGKAYLDRLPEFSPLPECYVHN